ncbi:MAG: molybdopterin synthase sulfur carrier subunit [Chloroflexi bacterium]|jgi:molybdopterin synthase sulfur carrier subunit|nr:molybdopterin synthase sulfur carrier subunit [Chloroflexota bacterium]MCH2308787.1 MoaD/ThiS family protein [SAR202 cluster bacterium]MQG05833.1 MoaD/ThiS family protein [SAR202 cluster bacterium]|tara:strand:- start:6941 stop:7225 length:285 start_codon:yes stop_codon:yes gene_type:complete
MSSQVRIPAPLRRLTNGQDKITAEGKTLQEIIDFLEQNFPTIKSRICNEDGEIRNFVNIYVNDEDVRFLNGISSEIKDGDEISIVPAVAGGSIK